ncbi:MAG TPA: hypothetical protein V6D48_07590 [Oculatellaceae cyanobacterium]
MNIVKSVKQQWKMLQIEYYFMQLVKAPYGDFTGQDLRKLLI